MIRFLLVSATGWIAVLGTGIGASLPYLLRNTTPRDASPSPTSGSAPAPLPNYRARLWPHYWIGYTLVALVLTHDSFTGPAMARSDAFGIWAATLALFLLFLQVGLGLILKSGSSNQRRLRRWHFWSMIVFAALLITHLVRNGI